MKLEVSSFYPMVLQSCVSSKDAFKNFKSNFTKNVRTQMVVTKITFPDQE